jgi:phosphatidylserine/phosphatidylglycerophosphate/cardiolipin synthase-like enzyme
MNKPSPTVPTDGRDNNDEGVSRSVWRFAKATRAHVVIDAADYFDLMQDAMLAARQQILMVGWDFDTRIRLGGGRRWWNLPRKGRFPARFGALIVWLVREREALQVRVLKWNFGALKFVLRGTMIMDLYRWWRQPRIDFKFDSAHPLGCSHHQKIVVIDDKFAVCGGIDMTSDRWDTPEHAENDPRRRRPNGKPYGPWHDMTMLIEGPAACALGDLGRARWVTAGGEPLTACDPQPESPWPEKLKAEFTDVEIGISRTRAAYGKAPEVDEIEELFAEHIARAKRFIYAESQYFASRRIAEAIAARLAQPDPPEIVLINPLSAEGWLEQAAMDGARVRLMHAIGESDPERCFRIYVPYAAQGTPIYVHAKLMIIDDEILRIGSANMNNRSMGLDTECDVFIDAARPGNAHASSSITGLRHTLLAEHCGLELSAVSGLLEKHGSMIAMIEGLAQLNLDQGKRLAPFALRPLTDAEKAVADNALLDPERPGEVFEPIGGKRGLFRRGGILRRPL